jgi:hypothetical protein
VTAEDRTRAGVVWETSCRVRDWLVKQSTVRKRQEIEARDERIIAREGRAEASGARQHREWSESPGTWLGTYTARVTEPQPRRPGD